MRFEVLVRDAGTEVVFEGWIKVFGVEVSG